MTDDLEDKVSNGLSDSARQALITYALETYVPPFSDNLKAAINRCGSREDVNSLLSRLEHVYQQVLIPMLEEKEGTIDKSMHYNSYPVTYSSDYPTLGHAIMDFRYQTKISIVKIARICKISHIALLDFEDNKIITKERSLNYFFKHETEIKKKFLNLFILPEQDQEKFQSESD